MDLDRIRMREVLANLIINAIHHTPAGGRIVVCVTSPGSGATIQVVDSGRGIAAEDLDGIFEAHSGNGGTLRGSGLGLAIARESRGLSRAKFALICPDGIRRASPARIRAVP